MLNVRFLFLSLFALPLMTGFASAQCTNGLIINCPAAISIQLNDVLLGYQLGQNPHTRKFTVGDLAAFAAGITFTDGTHTVTNVNHLAVTGGTIGGTTPNGTLLIVGGGLPPGGSIGQPLVNTGSGTGNWLNDIVASATNSLTLTGGAGSPTQNAGSVVITGGGGGSGGTGGNAGDVSMQGGFASSVGSAGVANVTGGNGSSTQRGGPALLFGGLDLGAGGGSATVQGASDGGGGAGAVNIFGGIGSSVSPGAVNVTAGASNATAIPGADVVISGGAAAVGDANGGNISISGGAKGGTGTPGIVTLNGNTLSEIIGSTTGAVTQSLGVAFSGSGTGAEPVLAVTPVTTGVGVVEADAYDPNGAQFVIASSRGTAGAPEATLTNDIIGSLSFSGYIAGTLGPGYATGMRLTASASTDWSGATIHSGFGMVNADNVGWQVAPDGSLHLDRGYVAGVDSENATAGSVTLSSPSGIVTSEPLAGASTYSLALTSIFLSATSMIQLTLMDSAGTQVWPTSITYGSNVATINLAIASALTGTITMNIMIVN